MTTSLLEQLIDALRVLHQQIRDHATKRSAGHPGRANDVKLSRGGIREIEFTVQLLQVVLRVLAV